MIESEKCCGCSACANICPKNAIRMIRDEIGFLYPVIEEGKCINCGLCDKICPIEKMSENTGVFQDCYAGYLKEEEQLLKSASGGAFYSLACGAISQGYLVYGVRYSDDYKRAEYTRIDAKEDLEPLRGSKYIQSDKGNVFEKIEQDLKSGRKILFVGLPCDTAALISYLRKPYEALLTVDLICYGCTTPMIAEQYVSWKEKKYKSVVQYMTVKDKSSGWENPSLYMKFKNGKKYRQIFRNTEYGVAFNKLVRSSCYCCPFKGENRWSDLTIGDYWGITQSDKGYNPKGVSLLYVNTRKGREALEWMEGFSVEKIDGDNARRSNVSLDRCQAPKDADAFRQKYLKLGLAATHDYKFWIRTMIPYHWLLALKKMFGLRD